MAVTSADGTGSSASDALAAARRRPAALIRARVRNPMRACPRVSRENPAGMAARAAIAGLPAREVRVRDRGGERS